VQYEKELQRIREKFLPLVKICKEYGTAMRIGTNHGSLSDRIMSRFGDTPLGMVESAFEFLRIAEDEGYYDVVLSMKASNPHVMVQAYRLLVNKMIESGRNYPLHLGVTEAGDGVDGRIKSSIGIGTLLEEGLGDTIRVSLTEDPELEIPVAKTLVQRYYYRSLTPHITTTPVSKNHSINYQKRVSRSQINIGAHHVPVVVMDYSEGKKIAPDTFISAGYRYNAHTDKWIISDTAADYIFLGDNDIDFPIPGSLRFIKNAASIKNLNRGNVFPLLQADEYLDASNKNPLIRFVEITVKDISDLLWTILENDPAVVLVVSSDQFNDLMELRLIFDLLIEKNLHHPVIIKRQYDDLSAEELILYASTDFGALLLDGLGDGIWLQSPNHSCNVVNALSFGILQGTRQRISKTEYISCPSCGRTLFDLQETTMSIRSRTHHLKGLKIAIMGCIVNGPGEMADADYGYVGSGVGKITLYKGKEIVKRNVDATIAVDELINLIRVNGDWVEEPDLKKSVLA
nr:flavodoxin-dependent (E)-4-hydroxy-3-methylbut-2-enyl-diphosphate synthase [Chitinophagales bacterium]